MEYIELDLLLTAYHVIIVFNSITCKHSHSSIRKHFNKHIFN